MAYRRLSLPALIVCLWVVAGLIVVMRGSLQYVNGNGLRHGLQAAGRVQNGLQKNGAPRRVASDPLIAPAESTASSGPLLGTAAVAAVMVSAVLATPGAAFADSVAGAKFDMKMPGFSKDASFGDEVKAFTRSDGASIRVGPVDYRQYQGSKGMENKVASDSMGLGSGVKRVMQNSRSDTADVLEYEATDVPSGASTAGLTVGTYHDTGPYSDVNKAFPTNRVWVKSVKKDGKEVAAMVVTVPVSPKISEEKAAVDRILKSFEANM